MDNSKQDDAAIFHFVYTLQSIRWPDKYYIGFTHDIDDRLKRHNSGNVIYTSKYRPWILVTYIAFKEEKKAIQFEKYLKTHSGRAFAIKHF